MIADRLLDFCLPDSKLLYYIDSESHSDNLAESFLRLLTSGFILKMDLMQKNNKKQTTENTFFF